jgi:O-antigen/teichoic acid export membrane protein
VSARIRALATGTGGSVLAGGGLQLIVAASGIIAARMLGVTDRGHLALLWVVTGAIGMLMSLGVHTGISFQIASGRSPLEVAGRLRRVIALQLLCAFTVAVPVEFALFGGERAQSTASLLAASLVPPLFVLLLHGIAFVQGARRYHLVQLHRLVQPSLYVVVLGLLAAFGAGRLDDVTVGWAATMAAGALFAWRQGLGAWWPPRAGAESDAEGSADAVLRFSLRSLFSSFGLVEHLQADLLVVGLLLSSHDFGLYVAASAFANLPEFLGQSVGYIAYPEVSSAAAERRGVVLRRFIVIGGLVVLPVVVVGVLALGWLLPFLFGHAFAGAVGPGRILLAGAFAQALRRVAAEGLRGFGSGVSASWAELSFIVVFAAAVAPLSSAHGASGAAVAVLLASVAAAGVLVVLSWRARPGRVAAGAPA